MKWERRVEYVKQTFKECENILATKGKSYTIGSDDTNRNFKEVARLLEGIPPGPIYVLMVYYLKQVFSLISICKGIKDPEGLQSRIHDTINYSLILGTLFEDENS
jgi:hypothetical protein